MAAAPVSPAACIFCEIVARRAPAHIVYEDERTLGFLDLFPVTKGHVLVVPKEHVDRLTDLPNDDFGGYLRAVSVVCRRVERLSRHYNVSINQGELAGQIVFHLHFHVIPRYGEGSPAWNHPRGRLDESLAVSLANTLAAP